MTSAQLLKLDRELSEYLDTMTVGIGRAERRRALGSYITGLLLDGERKSIEPMAARLAKAPSQTEALRQRLQQCVSGAAWDDGHVRCRLPQKLERELPGLDALLSDWLVSATQATQKRERHHPNPSSWMWPKNIARELMGSTLS